MKIKKLLTIAALAASSLTMTGCFVGERVEVPPAHVGKIQTRDGFQEGHRGSSRFRLDRCITNCDKLILLDVSDQRYTEKFKTFIPKDELELSYAISMTLAVDPKMYDFVFSNVTAGVDQFNRSIIDQRRVYSRYAESKIESVLPEIVANFTIAEIASSRGKVNSFIKSRLQEQLKGTPFILKHVGLTEVKYPPIILEAKEAAAERREQEARMIADQKLAMIEIQTERDVEEERREVEILKAKTKALVAKNLLTKEYETLLKYETLQAMAESNNKVIVPTEMLDDLAVQAEVK